MHCSSLGLKFLEDFVSKNWGIVYLDTWLLLVGENCRSNKNGFGKTDLELRISESLELLQASWSSFPIQRQGDRELVDEHGIAQGCRGPVKSNFVQKWQVALSKSDDWQWCWTATVNDRQSFYSATSIFAFGENVWAAASKGRFGLAVFRTAGLLETSKSRYCIG